MYVGFIEKKVSIIFLHIYCFNINMNNNHNYHYYNADEWRERDGTKQSKERIIRRVGFPKSKKMTTVTTLRASWPQWPYGG
jgi:hypothetical protein